MDTQVMPSHGETGQTMSVLERMVLAVERVRDRLLRATSALEAAGVSYAVIGGNAVAAWIATIDNSATRNTQDVDLLLDRETFPEAKAALERASFVYRHARGVDLFLDGPDASARDAIHVVFSGEKVRQEYALPAPSMEEAERLPGGLNVLRFDALVRMKLTSFRRKDQVHLLDLIGVGLIDEDTLKDLPDPLASRLRQLLEDPEAQSALDPS